MAATDVITLSDAKQYLNVDFTDDDTIIERAINTAVSWVERYTGHLLYERTKVYNSTGCPIEIYDYPATIQSVQDGDGNPLHYTTENRSLKLIVNAPKGAVVTVNLGYADLTQIPGTLLDACYKLLVYQYENRDTFAMTLPVDIQGYINQYRRGLF